MSFLALVWLRQNWSFLWEKWGGVSVLAGVRESIVNGVGLYGAAVCVPAAENVISIIFSIGIGFSLIGGGVDGLKIAIGTIHKQQRINKLEHPIANFPTNFCFENHVKNCLIVRIAYLFLVIVGS